MGERIQKGLVISGKLVSCEWMNRLLKLEQL